MTTSSTPDNSPVNYIDDKDLEQGLKLGLVKVKKDTRRYMGAIERNAVDLNLFKAGKYVALTEDHRPLGEWWESQGGAWGGRFEDGNHYSLEWKGRR